MAPIVIVQHEPSVPSGLIETVLKGSGFDHLVFEAWHESKWPQVEDIGALIVMGGTMNVDQTGDFPFLGESRRLMSAALDQGVPTLGVCLGSQMMARVLEAEVRRAEPRNASFSPLVFTDEGADDPVIRSFAGSLPVLQFHEDTFALPDGAVALARSASSGTYQAFRYGETAYAVQFHFEVDEEIVRGWCREIGDPVMAGEWGISTEDLLQQAGRYVPAQMAAGKGLVRAFLDLV